MRPHEVRALPPGGRMAREAELAWAIARVAADPAPLDPAAADMAASRVIDDVAVAVAALEHAPVASARAQALAHPRPGGATVLGLAPEVRVHCEWAAWANCAAVRELDLHDNFFALDNAHPGDTIPPLLAVAQQCGRSGADLLRGIVTAYEIQIDLSKSIPLTAHWIDHVAHLGPAVAAGIGAMLDLPVEVIYQAVQQAAHTSFSSRQTRKGRISSWKGHAPAFVGKAAVEAVDRAMRGETAPSPVYEGDQAIIAAMLGGPGTAFQVPLPEPGEPKRAILETYTKAHAAGYHGQAVIDLAIRMRPRIPDPEAIESVVLHTKQLTHFRMGSGSADPEKMDPNASRETLDHSVMYQFAVALQDGFLHHARSYRPERAGRPDTVRLWRKVRTVEDESWNRRYDDPPPLEKDHGCRAVVTFRDGSVLEDEIAVADAHPRGTSPFDRAAYVAKFRALTEGILAPAEAARFLALADRLPELGPEALGGLTVAADPAFVRETTPPGLF